MTLVLELPDDLQRRVEKRAKEANTTPEAVALTAISDSLSDRGIDITHLDTDGTPLPLPATPAEAIEYWERHGLIGPAAGLDEIGDTLAYARSLRENSERRAEG